MTEIAVKRPGEAKLKDLFKPGKVGKFEVKNRIKYGACCVSNYNGRDGTITPRELARVRVIAGTGCGLITNQGAYPDPWGEGKAYFRQVAIHDDKFLPQFEMIARYIHDAGAMAMQQILHAGRYGGIDLGYCIQPSVVPQTLPHFRPPREMTKEQIAVTVKQHADAAQRAIRAGFDATEITSFMGYLLANFNSRFTNQRTDEYGGSVQNRGRFMRELIDAIKQATPDNPLSVRLNGAELMDKWGGNTQDESFELMQQAVDCGVDMISVTVGWQEAPESSFGRDVEPGYWNFLSEKAKKMFPNVLVAFGNRLPDPAMADQCVRDNIFDYWEVCRPLLADPEMIHKAAEDRMEEVRPCIGSLNCLSRLFRDLPYTCTMNPMLGHEVEPEYHVTEATEKKRVMVIGAGPAGMEAAITARRRGHSVTVFDKADKIGGNLSAYAANDLARPADLQSVIDYYGVMAKKLGVEVRLNTEANAKFMRSILHEYDACIVAAGARTDLDSFKYMPGSETLIDALEVAHGKEDGGQARGDDRWRHDRPDHFRIPAKGRPRSHGSREGQARRRRHHAHLQVAPYRLGRRTRHQDHLLGATAKDHGRRGYGKDGQGRGNPDSLRQRHRLQPAQGQPRPVLRIPVDDRRAARRRRRHGAARPRRGDPGGLQAGCAYLVLLS